MFRRRQIEQQETAETVDHNAIQSLCTEKDEIDVAVAIQDVLLAACGAITPISPSSPLNNHGFYLLDFDTETQSVDFQAIDDP